MTVDSMTQSPVDIHSLKASLSSSLEFFNRSTSALTEEHAGFVPQEGMMTVCQQVSHVAHTVDWFRRGIQSPEGFDLDFEAAAAEIMAVTELAEARAWVERAFAQLLELVDSQGGDFWNSPLPEGPVMGGQPRKAAIGGTIEHTAHHRGALTVYARMLGLVPPMPYM